MKRTGIETGTVLRTDGTRATVITNKSASCNECGKAQAGICGKSSSGMVMSAQNPLGAVQGDIVEIGLQRKDHVKGYFVAFVLPVIALFAAALAGHLLSEETGIHGLDVTAGLAGLVLSILYSAWKIRSMEKSAALSITKILNAPAEYGLGSAAEEIDYLHAFKGSGR